MKKMRFLRCGLMVLGLLVSGAFIRANVTWAGDFLDKFDYEEDVEMNMNWEGIPSWTSFKDGVATFSAPDFKAPAKESGAWMTGRYKSLYGKYTVKFMTTNDPGNFIYLGWGMHDAAPNWMNPAAYVTLYDTLHLNVSNGADKRDSSVETSKVTPNEWHTATIIWQPTSVELIYDGKSIGKVTKAACIPAQALPLVLDVYRTLEAKPLILKVDEISVTAQ